MAANNRSSGLRVLIRGSVMARLGITANFVCGGWRLSFGSSWSLRRLLLDEFSGKFSCGTPLRLRGGGGEIPAFLRSCAMDPSGSISLMVGLVGILNSTDISFTLLSFSVCRLKVFKQILSKMMWGSLDICDHFDPCSLAITPKVAGAHCSL